MQPALPASDYYEGSATPGCRQPTADLPAAVLAARREGRHPGASHVHCVPVGRGGGQLFPGSLATGTPQAFPVASLVAKAVTVGVAAHHAAHRCPACAAVRPTSARFEPGRRLRGFHHWFTRHSTVLPCLPDPGRLAVPTRPVVVGAAPALPGTSQVKLPPASPRLLRQPGGGSFHPTRSHNASWRTALSAWTLAGRQRRPPAGVRTGGRSSSSASNTRLSLVLGPGHQQRQRQPTALNGQVQLAPALGPVDRVCANVVPPLPRAG